MSTVPTVAPVTTITPDELAILISARDQAAQAQHTLQFVAKHLTEKYGLQQGNAIDFTTGAITQQQGPTP